MSSRNQFSNGDTDESTKSYFSEVSISLIQAKNSRDFFQCIAFCYILNFRKDEDGAARGWYIRYYHAL